MPVPFAYIEAEYLSSIARLQIENDKLKAQISKYKRILELVCDDIYALRKGANCNICAMPQTDAEREKRCDPTNEQDCRFVWRYAEIIEKIIGDEQHESTLPHVQET